MANVCNVCADNYNKTVRKPVKCESCDFDACLACSKRFLCENLTDPCCMSCKKTWNYETLVQKFPKAFVTTALKEHRRNQLFERELSLMPATQPYVEREVQRQRMQTEIEEYKLEVKRLNVRYQELVLQHGNRRLPEKKEIKERIEHICALIRETQVLFYTIRGRALPDEEKQAKVVRHCPAADCRGFLNTKWECGLCNVKACKECHEIMDPNNGEHECKPENVETAKLLMTDSKPCPGCAVLIFKISGCNQMWCSNCGIAFDWASLRIDRGHIHNPEYFRALHAGRLPFARRDNNADVCGNNMPPDYQVVSHVNSFAQLTNAERLLLTEYYRSIRHYEQVFRPQHTRNIMDENRDLRISYMLKTLTDDMFKRKLQLREKASNKSTAIVQVLDMVITMGAGLFHDLLQNHNVGFARNKIDELKQLVNYGQECLQTVSVTYDCRVPYLPIE